jgi:rhodanese-related sulfurtransferase
MSVRFGVFPLVLAAAGCVVWPAGTGPGAAPIAAADALSMSERGQAVIVDVRPREAYEAGHIPGALHFDAAAIDAHAAGVRRLGRLPILYCG